jgi:chromosomal replication initiator protein
MQPNEIWQAALGELQLQMTRQTFNTWLKPTRAISREGNVFTIGVENGYVKEWLSNRLLATIQRTLTSVVGSAVEVEFVLWAEKIASAAPVPDAT